MRPVLLFLMTSIPVLAQPFSAGIKAGIPLSDFLSAAGNGTFNYSAPNQPYIIGGMAEVRLPFSLGVEFDVLYRHLSYTGSGNLVDVFTTSKTTGSNWEFPLLLKYRFHFPVVRPYVEAGAAWDTLTGLQQTITEVSPVESTTTASTPAELKQNTTMGFVLGGGIDIHALVIHISPEIRFTRWNTAQISSASGLLHSNQNQAEFLVGFTF